nr:PREDICTED: high-affinity choline transporter 1-like [Latimeria chalumnae]|eukprot:XP_014351109.1 PREDICTED: high-affinity choline transporter 1-like [Latimeria chalumnae]
MILRHKEGKILIEPFHYSMSIHIAGIVTSIAFYILILTVGLWAAKKSAKIEARCQGDRIEVAIIGGRNLGVVVGVLTTTGTTASVILDINKSLSIAISAFVVMIYTLLGGFYSVAYTDVVQLACIFIGLWLCVPFALGNPAVSNIGFTASHELFQNPWMGRLDEAYAGKWWDTVLLLVLGAIPWQGYFQRVLASSSPERALAMSIIGGLGSCLMALPSVLIGSVAASTDWNQTSYGLPSPYEREESSMILPLVLHHLCPPYVSIFGIGAISAAVMSSTDSSLLSSSSMFAHNIYKVIFRTRASEKEVLYVMKASVIVFGLLAMGLALFTSSVYGLWVLGSDIVYVVLFPQLVCVLYLPHVNKYGFIVGCITGAGFRIIGGEPLFNIPALIQYPGGYWKESHYIQLFPFKTFSMLCALVATVLFSLIGKCMSPQESQHCSELSEMPNETNALNT